MRHWCSNVRFLESPLAQSRTCLQFRCIYHGIRKLRYKNLTQGADIGTPFRRRKEQRLSLKRTTYKKKHFLVLNLWTLVLQEYSRNNCQTHMTSKQKVWSWQNSLTQIAVPRTNNVLKGGIDCHFRGALCQGDSPVSDRVADAGGSALRRTRNELLEIRSADRIVDTKTTQFLDKIWYN